jgi:hypothetical protein
VSAEMVRLPLKQIVTKKKNSLGTLRSAFGSFRFLHSTHESSKHVNLFSAINGSRFSKMLLDNGSEHTMQLHSVSQDRCTRSYFLFKQTRASSADLNVFRFASWPIGGCERWWAGRTRWLAVRIGQ